MINIDIIISTTLLEQALKSGHLPADFSTLDDNTETEIIREKHENMVLDDENKTALEAKDVEERGNNDTTPMEQVLKLL